MSGTTGQWQKLIDNADYAPWDFAAEYGEVSGRYGPVAQGVANNNFPLICAAPAAVAEIVRVRRELEGMRDWAESLGTGRPGGPLIAQKITRILDQEENNA